MKVTAGRAAMLALALLFIPVVASAGLTGDTVSAALSSGASVIFNTSAVVGAGNEFSGVFNSTTWMLNILDNGFSLSGTCTNLSVDCNYPNGLQLLLSGLDFTPPAVLTGVGVLDDNHLNLIAGSPTFTPSSVTIAWGAFTLDTGGIDSGNDTTTSATGTFQTRALVPLPATLALLSAGLSLTALAFRRRRA